MTWIIVVLIVLAVLLLAALAWTSVRRKRDQVARQRADELRSEAATHAADHPVQEARAREAAAEAERARARADQLSAQARDERVAFDQSQAHHEDRLREADRIDPDVDPHARDERLGTSPRDGSGTGTGTGMGSTPAAGQGGTVPPAPLE
jgi:FtsZ-interacting cell division protein ZipA